ncbi:MAG: hypothetical protein NKF70_10185 [Methanobacterium sp. ERen5]|nr:MAG: hypothetical protein NKF70_10185 [Methanobacterium sp. ERen5]
MKINNNIIFVLTLILGLSLVLGTVSAADSKTIVKTTVNKQTSVYAWEIFGYSYQNSYFKITKGNSYVNGYVTGINPMTGRSEKAPVYGYRVKITPLNSHVKIKKISIRSRGYPSGKLYSNTYYTCKNVFTPKKYMGFDRFTVYYTYTK